MRLSDLMAKLDSLLKKAEENPAHKEALDAALARSTELEASVQALTSDKQALSEQVSKLQADLKAAQDASADFEKRVEEAASKKAQEIVASIGHRPVVTKGPEGPVLTGLAKAIAAQRAENSKPINQ